MPKSNPMVWNYFEPNPDTKMADCKLCDRKLSYKTTTANLKQHLKLKHASAFDEYLEQALSCSKPRATMPKASNLLIWNYFDQNPDVGDKLADCRLCKKKLSYKTTITNLKQHLKQKHTDYYNEFVEQGESVLVDSSDDSSTLSESEKVVTRISEKKPKATWNYFTVTDSDKFEATCKICDRTVSYEFVSELTQHLRDHGEKPKDSDDEDYIPEVQQKMLKRKYKSTVWNYFEATDDKMAICLLCKKFFNYASSISNLRKHLQRLHKEINLNETPLAKRIYLNGELYEIANEQEHEENEDNVSFNDGSRSGRSSDDAAEELLKVTDVWNYFDTDPSGKRAQCVPCKTTVANKYEDLKAHLKDNHPKLLLQILQNKDQNSDAASNDGDTDNENIFTEVVYLEPEPTENVTKIEKPKSHSKPIKKRERRQSICNSDESPVKKTKKVEENDELSTFIKYITCLLKKLPADVFSNVQIEIINTILRANSQANTRSILFNKEQVNTCPNILTVDGITPITSTMVGGHNYTITVAAAKENEPENS